MGKNTENFYASKFMLANLVTEMADIAITHRSQRAIQTTIWSGTPFIGIGFHSEQQANIDGLVRAKMGERIALYNVCEISLLKALKEAQSIKHKESALKLEQLIRMHDGKSVC